MEIINLTRGSKVAARLRNMTIASRKQLKITVSEHSPESIPLTGKVPRSEGWRIENRVPLRPNGRKDYVRYVMDTVEKEVWIRLSTGGGRSIVYVR